jgi:hypothetical protein
LQTEQGPIPKSQLDRSGWLKHIRNIIDGALLIVKSVENRTNVLVHCSDGWDRTSQLCSLSEICLDPYFRTIDGFMVLVEKEWCSFGYHYFSNHSRFKFADRCGHLSRPSGDASGESGGSSSNISVMSQIEQGSKNMSKIFSTGVKSFWKQVCRNNLMRRAAMHLPRPIQTCLLHTRRTNGLR